MEVVADAEQQGDKQTRCVCRLQGLAVEVHEKGCKESSGKRAQSAGLSAEALTGVAGNQGAGPSVSISHHGRGTLAKSEICAASSRSTRAPKVRAAATYARMSEEVASTDASP